MGAEGVPAQNADEKVHFRLFLGPDDEPGEVEQKGGFEFVFRPLSRQSGRTQYKNQSKQQGVIVGADGESRSPQSLSLFLDRHRLVGIRTTTTAY